jgi:hypothetical protein
MQCLISALLECATRLRHGKSVAESNGSCSLQWQHEARSWIPCCCRQMALCACSCAAAAPCCGRHEASASQLASDVSAAGTPAQRGAWVILPPGHSQTKTISGQRPTRRISQWPQGRTPNLWSCSFVNRGSHRKRSAEQDEARYTRAELFLSLMHLVVACPTCNRGLTFGGVCADGQLQVQLRTPAAASQAA